MIGEHPEGGPVSVKQGRFGSYVSHGKINATIPRGTDPLSLTLDDALALLKAKVTGDGAFGRLLGQHPQGGPVTVREGRFGPYVNWGKVNATIPKSTPPGAISLSEALELLAEREGKPAPARKTPAKAAAGRAPAEAPAKSASQKSASAKGVPRKATAAAAKRPAAKAKPKAAVKKR